MRYLYLSLSVLVIFFDRWTKVIVTEHLSIGESVPVVRHFLDFTHSQNAGIAFGLFGWNPAPFQNWVLIALTAIAIGVVLLLAWRTPIDRVGYQVSFALIVGGAVGNLWDRIVYGQVTDFIDVYFRDHHWPIFNVADSAITVGVMLLAVGLIFFGETEAEERETA